MRITGDRSQMHDVTGHQRERSDVHRSAYRTHLLAPEAARAHRHRARRESLALAGTHDRFEACLPKPDVIAHRRHQRQRALGRAEHAIACRLQQRNTGNRISAPFDHQQPRTAAAIELQRDRPVGHHRTHLPPITRRRRRQRPFATCGDERIGRLAHHALDHTRRHRTGSAQLHRASTDGRHILHVTPLLGGAARVRRRIHAHLPCTQRWNRRRHRWVTGDGAQHRTSLAAV